MGGRVCPQLCSNLWEIARLLITYASTSSTIGTSTWLFFAAVHTTLWLLSELQWTNFWDNSKIFVTFCPVQAPATPQLTSKHYRDSIATILFGILCRWRSASCNFPIGMRSGRTEDLAELIVGRIGSYVTRNPRSGWRPRGATDATSGRLHLSRLLRKIPRKGQLARLRTK